MVSFFGHREVDNYTEVEKKLEKVVRRFCANTDYVEFLVGRNGDFDQMVASTVRRVKYGSGYSNCSLVLVLPYMAADVRRNEPMYLQYYDEIEVCSESERAHFKQAISVRNKEMVKRSDIVICYVNKEKGGAAGAVRFAQSEGKKIINLAKEQPAED